MKITAGKVNENKVTFTLDGASVGFANTVRRYGMVMVPVLAIDLVVFYDNNTAIFDEYVAHRLGLVPLLTPEKMPKNSEIVFTLDETGPKIAYSKDLKSSDKEIVAARDEIPLITLTEGQNIRLEGKSKVGTGKEHAKFQAGLLAYSREGEKFNFKVESFYQMTPKELILRTCDIIEGEVEEIKKGLKKGVK
ncbi:DNA-directed RNA polymerase subunit D [Candidatus Micrarchaeota archaeon]|nr:DNA-directed RNA polymerase subunit D [Candidatus Micrarchaeota archaeon]